MTEEKTKIRLQLYLSRCGIASRRKCADLIEQGKVTVNGEIITEPYFKVDPEKDSIEYLEIPVKTTSYLFFKLYKPVGYLTTMHDDRGRRTIADLIPSDVKRVFPVGRLDLDSEGLVILTNHGEAANRMMHPRYHFPRVYRAMLDKSPSQEDLVEMSRGIMLEGKKTIPASYELTQPGSKTVRVEIMEGRKRQIRRVFHEYGYKVVKLKRISIGPIKLGDMKPAEIRRFTLKEVLEILAILDLA